MTLSVESMRGVLDGSRGSFPQSGCCSFDVDDVARVEWKPCYPSIGQVRNAKATLNGTHACQKSKVTRNNDDKSVSVGRGCIHGRRPNRVSRYAQLRISRHMLVVISCRSWKPPLIGLIAKSTRRKCGVNHAGFSRGREISAPTQPKHMRTSTA